MRDGSHGRSNRGWCVALDRGLIAVVTKAFALIAEDLTVVCIGQGTIGLHMSRVTSEDLVHIRGGVQEELVVVGEDDQSDLAIAEDR